MRSLPHNDIQAELKNTNSSSSTPQTSISPESSSIPDQTDLIPPTSTFRRNVITTSSPSASPTSTVSSTSGTNYCKDLTNSSYDSVVLDDSPIAYFTFNELQAACDHTPHGHTGSKSGVFASTTMPNGDSTLVFDGSTNYIEVPDAESLSIPTTGKITVEAWIRPDTLQPIRQEGSGYVHWIGKGQTNNQEYLMRMYALTNNENRPNRISGYAFNSSGGLGVGSYFQDTVTAGNWIHAVLVINTTSSSSYPLGYTKIYKNGSQRDQDTLSSLNIVPSNGTAPFRIGTRDLNSFFQGAIGKVVVYNYELSAYQVLEHYQTMIPVVSGTASFVQNVGKVSTKTAGTTMQITVTEPVEAGNTLIARVLTDYSASAPTITDSRGNTYTRDRTAPNSGNTMRAAIFSAPVTTALQVGDTITITSANVSARAAVIDEFSGLMSSSIVDQQNGSSGSSTTPGSTISITTTVDDTLIVGFTGVEGPLEDTFTEDDLGQFDSLTREGTDEGTDNTNITINGGYKSVSVTGTYSYRPSLDPTRNWINFVVAYKAL